MKRYNLLVLAALVAFAGYSKSSKCALFYTESTKTVDVKGLQLALKKKAKEISVFEVVFKPEHSAAIRKMIELDRKQYSLCDDLAGLRGDEKKAAVENLKKIHTEMLELAFNPESGCKLKPEDKFTVYVAYHWKDETSYTLFNITCKEAQSAKDLNKLVSDALPKTSAPVDAKTYMQGVKIFRFTDGELITGNTKGEMAANCNDAILIVPNKIVDEYGSTHLAYSFFKEKIKR
jgi:hypothetical protein